VPASVVLPGSAASAQTLKVAYWNFKSGKWQVALPGHPASFVDTSNCTDPRLNADPSIVALGLGEAWVCGTPGRVRAALSSLQSNSIVSAG